jgi:hypothetical protein
VLLRCCSRSLLAAGGGRLHSGQEALFRGPPPPPPSPPPPLTPQATRYSSFVVCTATACGKAIGAWARRWRPCGCCTLAAPTVPGPTRPRMVRPAAHTPCAPRCCTYCATAVFPRRREGWEGGMDGGAQRPARPVPARSTRTPTHTPGAGCVSLTLITQRKTRRFRLEYERSPHAAPPPPWDTPHEPHRIHTVHTPPPPTGASTRRRRPPPPHLQHYTATRGRCTCRAQGTRERLPVRPACARERGGGAEIPRRPEPTWELAGALPIPPQRMTCAQ